MNDNHRKKSSSLKWYYKNREEQIRKNREWKNQNKEKMLEQKRKHYQENKEKILTKKKEYRLKNKEKTKEYRQRLEVKEKAREHSKKYKQKNPDKIKQYLEKNKEKIAIRQKKHSQLPHIKARKAELARIRRRLNPQSNRSYSLELQLAMNMVRLRDGNKCQWQGCNITHKEDKIHVHHIFPRNEHPELELVEAYMICYCSTHHRHFHRLRGDPYSEMIKSDNPDLTLDYVSGRD